MIWYLLVHHRFFCILFGLKIELLFKPELKVLLLLLKALFWYCCNLSVKSFKLYLEEACVWYWFLFQTLWFGLNRLLFPNKLPESILLLLFCAKGVLFSPHWVELLFSCSKVWFWFYISFSKLWTFLCP